MAITINPCGKKQATSTLSALISIKTHCDETIKTRCPLTACLAPLFTAQADDGFSSAIRPITAPTAVDLAIPRTEEYAIHMHQNLPENVNVAGL